MKRFIIALVLLASCQKQPVDRLTLPEKLSLSLLDQYIDYEMSLERKAKWGIPVRSIPSNINDLINTFLTNERNLIKAGKMLKLHRAPEKTEAPGEPYDNGISCIGKFYDYNTINTIVFTVQLDGAQTTITSSAFAFGGIGATWTPVGAIEQNVYDGVITYKQYYQESYQLPGGVNETQLYVMYGNIYNGGCTVYGMQIKAPE